MSRLALAAAMLMAVAPTISRTVAAPEAAMPAEVAMQAAPMCVSGHLQDAVAVLPEAAGHPAHGEHPGMPGPHPDDPACGYCTLEVAMQAAPMCVSGHLQDAVAVLPEAAVQPAHGEHPGMPGPHPDDPACGYCTLVAPPALFVPMPGVLPGPIAAAPHPGEYAIHAAAWRNVRGLGGQAPPSFS